MNAAPAERRFSGPNPTGLDINLHMSRNFSRSSNVPTEEQKTGDGMKRIHRIASVGGLVAVSFFAGVMVDRAVKGPVGEAAAADGEEHAVANESGRRSGPSFRRSRDLLDSPDSDNEMDLLSLDEALDRLPSTTDINERDDLVHVILRDVEPGQVSDLLPRVEQLRPGRARDDLIRGLLRRMAEEQPVAALDYASEMPLSSFRRITLQDALASWLERDLEPALEWTLAHPNAVLRSNGLRTAIGQLSESDPQRALELAGHLGPDQAEYAMGSIFDRWASIDPEAASRRLARMPTGRGRLSAVSSVAMSWAREDPQEALEWAQGLENSSEARRAVENVVREYGYQDPEAAFRLASGVEAVPDYTLESIAGRWAAQNPDEAIPYIQSLPRNRRTRLALNSAIQEVAYERPMEAMQLVSHLEPGPARNNALRAIASELASDDAEAAAAWVMQLPNEEERAASINDVILRWTGLDPAAAANFVEGLPQGPMRENATREVISNWARHEPAEAARWARTNDALRPEVAEDLAWGWAEQDERAAARWVRTLPQGDARDGATSVISDMLARNDPEEGWRWAQQISDPERQQLQMERIADDWMRYDRDAAMAFVGDSELSPQAQARLLGLEEEPAVEEEDSDNCCPCELAEEIDIDYDEAADAEYEGDYDDEEEYEDEA